MLNNQTDKLSKEEMIAAYDKDVQLLSKYIPWLESKKGLNLTNYYSGDLESSSLTIPTYDPTLLNFVKDVQRTNLIEKNYQYTYSKFYLKTYQDEWKIIDSVKLVDIATLKAILSRYILKGRIKAVVWNEGVENEVYLRVLNKLRELMETWDQPLA